MSQRTLRNIFITRSELIEGLLVIRHFFPECLIQRKYSNDYEPFEWDKLSLFSYSRTICACLPGTVSKMPYDAHTSPFRLGCIFCDDPERYEGFISESHLAFNPDFIEDTSMGIEAKIQFGYLLKQLRCKARTVDLIPIDSDRIIKMKISEEALHAARNGTKLCLADGPNRSGLSNFEIVTPEGTIPVF